jgi:hypothetical protein
LYQIRDVAVQSSKWTITCDLAPLLSLVLYNLSEGIAAILVALASVKCPNISYIRVWDGHGWMFLSALAAEGQLSLEALVIDRCDTPHALDFSCNSFPNLQNVTIGALSGECKF